MNFWLFILLFSKMPIVVSKDYDDLWMIFFVKRKSDNYIYTELAHY